MCRPQDKRTAESEYLQLRQLAEYAGKFGRALRANRVVWARQCRNVRTRSGQTPQSTIAALTIQIQLFELRHLVQHAAKCSRTRGAEPAA